MHGEGLCPRPHPALLSRPRLRLRGLVLSQRGCEAGRSPGRAPAARTPPPGQSSLMFDASPSFICTGVPSGVGKSNRRVVRREINLIALLRRKLRGGGWGGQPEALAPAWTHGHARLASPFRLHRPEIRQDMCHLWVLKCTSQKPVKISSRLHPSRRAVFFSRLCRAQPCPETADALAEVASRTPQGFQSQSQGPLWPPASDAPGSTPEPPPGPRPSAPGERLSAARTVARGGISYFHLPGQGGGPGPKHSIPPGSSLCLPHLLFLPPDPEAAPPSQTSSLPFHLLSPLIGPSDLSLCIASSRQPALTAAKQGQRPFFSRPQLFAFPTPMLPLPLWEGRAYWVFFLTPRAMNSRGWDLVSLSQSLTWYLHEYMLPE